MKSVDHAFPHRHADAVALILVKPCRFGHPHAHLFSEIHALDVGIQGHFQVLGLWRHSGSAILGIPSKKDVPIRNTAPVCKSMEPILYVIALLKCPLPYLD